MSSTALGMWSDRSMVTSGTCPSLSKSPPPPSLPPTRHRRRQAFKEPAVARPDAVARGHGATGTPSSTVTSRAALSPSPRPPPDPGWQGAGAHTRPGRGVHRRHRHRWERRPRGRVAHHLGRKRPWPPAQRCWHMWRTTSYPVSCRSRPRPSSHRRELGQTVTYLGLKAPLVNRHSGGRFLDGRHSRPSAAEAGTSRLAGVRC